MKGDLSTQSSISQDPISTMVSNIESDIKAKMAPILNLVDRLPINVPRHAHVSQGGDRDVGSSMGSSEHT